MTPKRPGGGGVNVTGWLYMGASPDRRRLSVFPFCARFTAACAPRQHINNRLKGRT